MKCIKCQKALTKIGTERKNGTTLTNHNGKDWEERQLHKKCWKDLKETQNMYFTIYCNDDERLLNWIRAWKERWGFNKLL